MTDLWYLLLGLATFVLLVVLTLVLERPQRD